MNGYFTIQALRDYLRGYEYKDNLDEDLLQVSSFIASFVIVGMIGIAFGSITMMLCILAGGVLAYIAVILSAAFVLTWIFCVVCSTIHWFVRRRKIMAQRRRA